MSTRGAVLVKVGRKVFESYNHSDSYPSWLGVRVCAFVRENLDTPEKVAAFKTKVEALKVVKQQDKPTKEEAAYYMALEISRYDNLPDDEKQEWNKPFSLGIERTKMEYYALLREFQGAPGLEGINDGSVKHWVTNKGFIKDSLFCEFAYLLDLNKGVLEFYEGFQKAIDPATGVPKQKTDRRKDGTSYEYAPCKKVGEVPFALATEEIMNGFFKTEEEEAE